MTNERFTARCIYNGDDEIEVYQRKNDNAINIEITNDIDEEDMSVILGEKKALELAEHISSCFGKKINCSKKVYLASPFFNDGELEQMHGVKNILRAKGLDVFVPNEHQSPELEFGSLEWREATFNGDVNGIDNADLVVAVVDGNYCDSGTAWEIGYAYATNKPIVVVNINKNTINLMIADSLHALINSYEELVEYDFNEMPKIPYLNYIW